jgi:hypothetical protein
VTSATSVTGNLGGLAAADATVRRPGLLGPAVVIKIHSIYVNAITAHDVAAAERN